ncbi:hypothetical protein EJB05_37024, partial [Eragrostis curvula]
MGGTAADRDVLEEKLQNPSSSPISLPYEFLKDITNNFSTEQELGRGGFGVVYKGVLRSGQIIAVKELLDSNLVNDDVFEKEVTDGMGIKHKNIVQLVGYCAETRCEAIKLPNGNNVMAEIRKRLLCFEYLPNKSLDKYISEELSGLDWNKTYEIIKEICSGLHFLNHVLVKWRNIFKEEPKYTSPEIYTEQVKGCINIALQCVDLDSMRRPDICDIFEMLTGETCGCQKMTLLSVQSSKLCFNFKTPHVLGFSSLHLTNNIDDVVAFRIKTNDRNKCFLGPVHGLVLPRSVYTLRLAMSLPQEDDNCFAIKLECTIAGDQYQLTDIEASGSASDYSRLFEKAKNKGHEVQQKKLLFTIAHEKGDPARQSEGEAVIGRRRPGKIAAQMRAQAY